MTRLTVSELARFYPEVLEAHAQFGGDLAEMLRNYHDQVVREQSVPVSEALRTDEEAAP